MYFINVINEGSMYCMSRTFDRFLVLEHDQDAKEVTMHLDKILNRWWT